MMSPHFPQIMARCMIALVCAGFLLKGNAAQAGNWQLFPTLEQSGMWQSNVLMSRQDPIELYGSITTANLMMSSKTPTSSLDFGGKVLQNIFNESGFNSTDFHGQVQAKKRVARWEAALKSSGDYDTTRTSEITSFGLDTKTVRHTAYSATPELTFQPNETNKIAASVTYSVSRYDDTIYTDYNVANAKTTWTHQLTPQTSGLFLLKARRYQTENNTDKTVDSAGPSLGFHYAFSERLIARMTAGLEASKQEGENIAKSSWEWSTVFSGGLNFKGEQDVLDVTASREQQPYGNGTSSLLTALSFTENHAINQRYGIVIGGRYARAQQSATSSSTLKNQMSGNAGVVYHATQEVDVSALYRYREESYRGTSDKATDNSGMVNIQYRPVLGARR